MLKDEKIKVVVNDCYTIQEEYHSEQAKAIDDLRKDNPDMGNMELTALSVENTFVRRVVAWKFDQECTEQFKRVFFKQYPRAAKDALKEADKLIEEERENLLGNLLTGANGI